jgi:hypothetical protein
MTLNKLSGGQHRKGSQWDKSGPSQISNPNLGFWRKVPWLLPEVSRILAGDLDPGVSRYLEGTIVTLPYPELTPGQPTIVKVSPVPWLCEVCGPS